MISSDKKIPVSTIISVYFHDLFNPGSFVHVQLEDIPLAQDSEDWIIGNARDPRNEIFPIESVPVFWLHTQPAMISEKGALLPESGGNCLPTALIKSKTVILYLVGGGFINGSSVEGPRCYDIARATGIRVLGLSYRKVIFQFFILNVVSMRLSLLSHEALHD